MVCPAAETRDLTQAVSRIVMTAVGRPRPVGWGLLGACGKGPHLAPHLRGAVVAASCGQGGHGSKGRECEMREQMFHVKH